MEAQEKPPVAPATIGLAVSWILVFVGMIIFQGGMQTGGNIISSGISPWTSHPFGDLTTRELMQGQVWRALTATFIHYSIPHIFFNLLGLYQLGRLVEAWYGSSQFLGLYVVIGFVGNVLAALAKPLLAVALKPWITVQVAGASGGGSGVLCGLIAMLAVVGWRSKSRYGDYLKAQMIGVLVFTGILGIVIPHIDNFGHAGGAIVGALCGFLDPVLLRRAEKPERSYWIGILSVLAIVASFGLQWNQARTEEFGGSQGIREVEQGLKSRQDTLLQLTRLALFYRELANRGEKQIIMDRSPRVAGRRPATRPEVGAAAEATVKMLEAPRSELSDPQTVESLKTLFALTRLAEKRRPYPGEIALFDRNFAPVATRVEQERLALAQVLKQVRQQQAEAKQPVAKKKPKLGS